MAPSDEVSSLQCELRSIERLIEELLQRQTELSSRLSSLEPGASGPLAADAVAGPSHAVMSSPGLSSWTSIVQGRKKHNKKISLPLYEPPSIIDTSTITLKNFFSPLTDISYETAPSPITPPARRTVIAKRPTNRKRPAPATSSNGALSPSAAPAEGKRARLSLLQLEPVDMSAPSAPKSSTSSSLYLLTLLLHFCPRPRSHQSRLFHQHTWTQLAYWLLPKTLEIDSLFIKATLKSSDLKS